MIQLSKNAFVYDPRSKALASIVASDFDLNIPDPDPNVLWAWVLRPIIEKFRTGGR